MRGEYERASERTRLPLRYFRLYDTIYKLGTFIDNGGIFNG